MGKLIYNFSQFLNESENKETSAAGKLLQAASAYTDTSAYKAEQYDSPEKLAELTATLNSEISSSKGEAAAAEFSKKALEVSTSFIKEGSCKECEEMMEPCEACKKHAEEMEENGEGEKL